MNVLPLVLYGSTTCEDTAIIGARLRNLGIPFDVRYAQEDPNVNSILEKYNNGSRVTPTLVFGSDRFVAAEPSLEQLETLVSQAGYTFHASRGTEIRGDLGKQRMPNFTLPSSDGTAMTLYKLPRRRRAVLLFVQDAGDRVGQGYTRQLTNDRALFDEYNALPIPILASNRETTRAWAREFARGYAVLSDESAAVKLKYAGVLGVEGANMLLVILDAFCVPRVISHADDAGGLIAPGEVTSWLRLLDFECDE